MRLELIAVSVVLAGALATPAAAGEKSWPFRDWTTYAETIDTGEDIRTTCTASTGGDGYPVVYATLSNGDVSPPDAYPSVIIEERAPRHNKTVMQNGDVIRFLFDDGDSAATTAFGELDAQGFAYAVAEFYSPDSQLVLQAMRRNGQIEILRGSDIVYTASLNGFTAAYGKMAEACGFSTIGVID